jgi:hypothetical protein
MPTPSDQSSLTPDDVFNCCLGYLREQPRLSPPPSTLGPLGLVWSMTIAVSWAYEIALRTFIPQNIPNRPDQTMANELGHRALQYIPRGGLPPKEALYELYRAWHHKHPDWPDSDTMQPVLHLSMCWTGFHDDRLELRRKVQGMVQQQRLLVWKALGELYGGIREGDPQNDNDPRQKAFFLALAETQKRTAGRKLIPDWDGAPIPDLETIAVEGALTALRGGELSLTNMLIEKQFASPSTDRSDQVYKIPPLPIRGMQDTVVHFRPLANTFALHHVFAKLAPGVSEVLDKKLSDAAHARQRRALDAANSQDRGGPGTSKTARKDKTKGKKTPPVKHVQLDTKLETEDGTVGLFALPDGRDRQKQIEARELLYKAYKLAGRQWGPKGKAMLKALMSGATDKEAATKADITAPTVRDWREKLRKELDL